MIHAIDLTGDYRTTIYGGARELLATGADSADTIETYRNGQLSMSGQIGAIAKLSVRSNTNGRPSLELIKWMPFVGVRKAPGAALDDPAVATAGYWKRPV